MVRHISSGSSFEVKFGYSRAVIDGDMVYVSGTTGYDYKTMTLPEGLKAQTENTLENLSRALGDAGCSLSDVLRVRYILPDISDLEAIAPLLADAFAKARPAATMIVAGLIDKQMKIEIEVTARMGASKVFKPERPTI